MSEKTSAESREGGDSWAPAPEVSGSNAGARAGGNVINGPESEAKRHRLKPEPESQGGGFHRGRERDHCEIPPTRNCRSNLGVAESRENAFSAFMPIHFSNLIVLECCAMYCHTMGLFMSNLKFCILQVWKLEDIFKRNIYRCFQCFS